MILSSCVLSVLAGCGGSTEGGADSGAADAGDRADARPIDAAREDGAVLDDGAIGDDAAMLGDAAMLDDGGVPGDGAIPADGGAGCTCDTTSLCDTGCACDIACSVVPGAPPLGDEALLMERGEIAVHFPSVPTGAIDRVTVRDDGYAGAGGPAPAFRALLAPTARPAMTLRPVSFASDVDGDGREEVVLVTPTSVIVEDWSGTTLTARTVHTYASATYFDGAAGDVTSDGVPDLVVSHQSGDTLVVEVLALGASGTATVLASTTRTNVYRHAITVARPTAGADPEIYLLEAGVEIRGRVEPLTVIRFTVSGATLAAGTSVSLGGICLVWDTPIDEGVAIAVGNTDADAESEIAYAVYCEGGSMDVALRDGALTKRWLRTGGSELDPATAARDRFRPVLMMARVGPTTLSPSRIVTAIAPASGSGLGDASGPQGQVVVLENVSFLDRLSEAGGVLVTAFDEHSIVTDVAVRDLDRDGRDEFVVGYLQGRLTDEFGGDCSSGGFPGGLDPCVFSVTDAVARVYATDTGAMRAELVRQTTSSPVYALGPGPSVAAGDLDADSVRVRATGNVYLHTAAPIVNAVLSAPPTWMGRAGVRHTDASGTTLGVSTSAGGSDTRSINASAAVTVSAGADFGVASFSASVTASVELSSSVSMSREVSVGIERSVGDDADLVVMRVVPYASYEYEVVAHSDPAEIGSMITIDVPGAMIETVRTLADFRAEHGALADAIVPPALLPHTIGDPSTYPGFGSCTTAAIQSRVGGAGTISAVPGESALPTPVDVGNAPSGGQTLSIDVTEQTGTATDVSLGVEISVGVMAGGVGLEASAGIGYGWTHETFVGRGVAYSGAVGYLAEGYGIDTRYEWNVCVFHFTNRQHGSYPVVSYTVRRY